MQESENKNIEKAFALFVDFPLFWKFIYKQMISNNKYMFNLVELKKNNLSSSQKSVAINSFSHATPLIFTGGKHFKYTATLESAFHCSKTHSNFQQDKEVISSAAASVKNTLEE